jgi:predicted acetyltransferase
MAGRFRKYDSAKDKKATHRIWQECGWIEGDKKETDALDTFVRVSDGWVWEVKGSAEALTISTPARYRHTGTDLSMAAITGVTTSRVARGRGAAGGTLARALAAAGKAGVAVAGLGMFEQGYYNKFGFGNGSYESFYRFDPAWLRRFEKPAPPVRLGPKDWKAIHSSRLQRMKHHGAVDLIPPEISKCELAWVKNPFGLGYKKNGTLTHFFVAHTEDVEQGPYYVEWLVYENLDQLRELISLIRSLGDQVRSVRLRELPWLQIQSIVEKPFQLMTISNKGRFESRLAGEAYWQLRILDVEACVAALSVTTPLRFTLSLDDPIRKRLPDSAKWKGCGGTYVVELGERSSAKRGKDADLPVLEATVNDFTRFWMGSASAATLAAFDSFRAPHSLIAALDETVRLPKPYPDWDY